VWDWDTLRVLRSGGREASKPRDTSAAMTGHFRRSVSVLKDISVLFC
jgi:hypothetical protein